MDIVIQGEGAGAFAHQLTIKNIWVKENAVRINGADDVLSQELMAEAEKLGFDVNCLPDGLSIKDFGLVTLDMDSTLYTRVNKAMVKIRRVTDKYDVQELKGMIQEHVAYTNSEVGKRILDHFEEYLPKFKKIIPEDYEKMMAAIFQMEEKGLSREKAQIEAFNKIKNGR